MDLLEYIMQEEQNGINAIFIGKAIGAEWLGNGNYLKIYYKNCKGKIVDTHPHIETVIKFLARSSLTVSCQKELLQDCEHDSAIKYLESLQHNYCLEKLIADGYIKDEYFGF